MRILLIADPGIPVPPKGYGGIERVVAGLASAYSKLGHEVTVLASSGSSISGVKTVFHSKAGFPAKNVTVLLALIKVWIHLLFNRRQYDLIQNFGRLANFFPLWWSPQLKFMCYQRHISRRNIQWAIFLRPNRLKWVACSRHLISSLPNIAEWNIIHNPFGNDYTDVELMTERKKSLLFLGRLDRIKGCHHAIAVAKSTGFPLLIAGNVSKDPEEIRYFNSMILPEIDGVFIQYIGEVDDRQKAEILAHAGVLLFPIEWNEPFGIVMAEAMSYGTPVVAFNRGSTSEVIEQGITGFVVDSIEEMKNVVPTALSLDRSLCKSRARERFSVPRIAEHYLTLVNQ